MNVAGLHNPGDMNSSSKHSLPLRAAARYLQPGQPRARALAYHMARGKLAGDPVFFGILRNALIPDGARVLDLGCGKALFEALLCAADEHPHELPADVPRVPSGLQLSGIELSASDVAHASRALGKAAHIRQGDICHAEFPPSDLVLILDVLHYLPPAAQLDVLRRAHAALPPGGRLLMRVGDAAGGWKFRWSTWVDKLVVFARCGKWLPLWGRPLQAWTALLQEMGFSVRQIPMSAGTGFANVLLVADKP